MITDPLPRQARKREAHLLSDRITSLPLPPGDSVQAATLALAQAMAGGQSRPVRVVCADLLQLLSRFYEIATPDVRVLGVRPHVVTQGVCTYQLFGDYTPSTQRIRVWLRTAIREKVSSPKAFLNTLLHEFCHHLDATRLGCPDSPHTRGFFQRIDHLYHLALATPPERRRPLHWIKRGPVYSIDWRRSTARARPNPPASAE